MPSYIHVSSRLIMLPTPHFKNNSVYSVPCLVSQDWKRLSIYHLVCSHSRELGQIWWWVPPSPHPHPQHAETRKRISPKDQEASQRARVPSLPLWGICHWIFLSHHEKEAPQWGLMSRWWDWHGLMGNTSAAQPALRQPFTVLGGNRERRKQAPVGSWEEGGRTRVQDPLYHLIKLYHFCIS